MTDLSSLLTATVTDPVKNVDKYGQGYIVYKVNSQSTRVGFQHGEHTVERRYSDFSWLSSELSHLYPGAIVPPLPEKQVMGKFSQEFVESRRRSLERFLERIFAHPELGYSHLVAAFLQHTDDQFSKLKDDIKSGKPKLTTTAMAWLEGTVTSLAHGKAEIEKSAADLKIEEITAYVSQLEKQMANATKYAEALVKSNKETAKALFDFGQSISYLGQAEGENIGAGLGQLGTAIDSLSSQTSAHTENETIHFLEPFEEYARMLASIKTALGQRAEKKSAYLQSITDYEAKTAAHKKALSSGKESQARVKEQLANNAKEQCDKLKEEFETVSERLLTEFDTFKAQKANDMKEILVSFVKLQFEYNQRMEAGWKDVLPRLEAISLQAVSYPNSRPTAPTNPFASPTDSIDDYRRSSMPNIAPPITPGNSGYQNHPNHSNFSEHNEDELAAV